MNPLEAFQRRLGEAGVLDVVDRARGDVRLGPLLLMRTRAPSRARRCAILAVKLSDPPDWGIDGLGQLFDRDRASVVRSLRLARAELEVCLARVVDGRPTGYRWCGRLDCDGRGERRYAIVTDPRDVTCGACCAAWLAEQPVEPLEYHVELDRFVSAPPGSTGVTRCGVVLPPAERWRLVSADYARLVTCEGCRS